MGPLISEEEVMATSALVRVTSFGEGRFETQVPPEGTTIRDVLREHGVGSQGRRVAVNGHPADLGSTVLEGDEVTVVPRVRGG